MMDRFKVREAIAESGKMTVRDAMAYLDMRFKGLYNKQEARAEAKEMIAEAKSFMNR